MLGANFRERFLLSSSVKIEISPQVKGSEAYQ
jgi:hypothetical protein